jgi:predicted lipoprotein with Yx(FWY)xxD motif
MHLLRSAVAMLFVASVITSCSKDDNDGGSTPPPTPKKTVQVTTNTTFGKVLTDSTGKTLYFFSNDAQGTPTCKDGCAAIWPVFYLDVDKLTVDTSLDKADFTTVTRPDGSKQTAYKGWPLYYYANDAAAGDTKGDNVGNIWFVAKPDYTVMVANFQLHGNDGNNYVLDNTGAVNLGTGASKYLVDDRGHTLYKFANDKSGKNNFTNTDETHNAIWPIYEVSEVKNVPTGFAKTDFAIITVLGKKQITYKGWPLYYFGTDAKVMGANKGVSVPSPNAWPVVYTTTATAPLP